MEYIDLRKLKKGELKQVRRQAVRPKKMGKPGKNWGINRSATESRQRNMDGVSTKGRQFHGTEETRVLQKGTHLLLTPEEQAEIQKTIITRRSEEFRYSRQFVDAEGSVHIRLEKYQKNIPDGSVSGYMRRWGLTCQYPVKRTWKQNPSRI